MAVNAGYTGRISAYLIRSAVVASLCGLLFGFETAVISGTTEWLKAQFALSNSMLGFTGSAFAFYALCMAGQLLWVLFVMPETKGVPLEQIQKRMGIQ